jgi:hypothetical protein
MTKGSSAAGGRLSYVALRERLPSTRPVNLVFRPDGLVVAEISDQIRSVKDLCDVFTVAGTEAMNSPIWTHRSASGTLSTVMIPTRHLHRPVMYHELDGPAIVEVRGDLSVDEAAGRLMPVFSAVANKYWKLNLSIPRHAV